MIRSRGRPRKEDAGTSAEVQLTEDIFDVNDNKIDGAANLSELRILGSDHILSKVFVSEALVCDDPIEAHIYDVLGDAGQPLPCFYCGDVEQKNLFSLQTDEHFPLCKACQEIGRGHGLRRKSRAIKPAPIKLKKKPAKPSKKSNKRKVFID